VKKLYSYFWITAMLLAAFSNGIASAQTVNPSPVKSAATTMAAPQTAPQSGTINGTVVDVYDALVPGATVILDGPNDHRTITANENGFFEFDNVNSGKPYMVTVSEKGFGDWSSPSIILTPGQFQELANIKLQVATQVTTVTAADAHTIALEEVHAEVNQRILGIIPNFYTVYEPNSPPLSSALKFKLAFKTSFDPVTMGGVFFVAGLEQAGHDPDYVEGMRGYGQRVGATGADGFVNIMFGGAILPVLLHQDPRFFYQGTGTKKSRVLHALSTPFICKGDNGRWEPNFSSVGGDLIAGAVSNAYYPETNRGLNLVLDTAMIGAGGRMVNGLVQEFLLLKLTPKSRYNGPPI
jgi:hypothetical protein